jgi:hypothetical protein
MTTQLNPRLDTPRELDQLMAMDRSKRYLVGMHLGIFKGTSDEQAFLGSANDVQSQRLRDELLRRDAEGWPEEGEPLPAVPVMPSQEPDPEPQAQENNMQPPQFPSPVIPSTVGQQQQQQQAPSVPSMPQANAPVQMGMPQMPMGAPQVPMFPTAGAPSSPQMPQAAPQGMPQMQPPQWQMPPQAAPGPQAQQPVLPSGRNPPVPGGGHPSGLGEVLSKVAEVQSANQKLLDAIHGHQIQGNALMLQVLGTMITLAEMQGLPRAQLAQAVSQIGRVDDVKNFLQMVSGGQTQGKG